MGEPEDLKELDEPEEFKNKTIAWVYVRAKNVGGKDVKRPTVMSDVGAESDAGSPAQRLLPLLNELGGQVASVAGPRIVTGPTAPRSSNPRTCGSAEKAAPSASHIPSPRTPRSATSPTAGPRWFGYVRGSGCRCARADGGTGAPVRP
ncbi:hypothetical protein [Streptomyces sp. NPDC048639]|uniref:hypothetical protein n=1 Tax=Streptomyces sp. NPDC048639 TaxID=3365581 RepID=UPI00371FAD79